MWPLTEVSSFCCLVRSIASTLARRVGLRLALLRLAAFVFEVLALDAELFLGDA